MSDKDEEELVLVVRNVRRQVRQRLEGLGRSGVPRIPRVSAGGRIAPPAATRRATAEPIEPDTAVAPTAPTKPPPPAPLPVPPTPSVPPISPASRPPAARAPSMPLPRPRRSLFDEPEVVATEYGPPVLPAERPAALAVIAQEVAECTRCPTLVANRTNTVPGEGSPEARLVFMGEAPGADEDRTGRPFVGRAGLLLNDMIVKGMGLKREDVFILNTIKCRPPENRVPLADEQANCRGFLERQLAILRPEFLCLLGKTAALAILDVDPGASMGKIRGRWFDYRGIRTLVTYHPAYLLRNPAAKKDAWEDLKFLMSAMGLEPPARG